MFKRNNAFTSRGGWIPYFVFGISFFVTVLTTYVFGNTVHEKDKLRFDTSVSQNHITVEDRIQTYIDLLRATEGLLAASDFVNGSEFKEFVGRLDIQRKYPGIQGIGYTIRLRQDEVPLIIEQMRNEGVSGFDMYPDYEREEYHAILYLEPLDRRNKAAIGYDMFTEENRREAMIRARDTGLPAASKKVTLVQEIDETKQPGFLIYVPLYKDDSKPFTIEERRNTLVGYVYSPFRVHDLFNGIFRRRHPINVDFTVYEGIEESEEHI